jgi:hypothetical protein
LDIGNRALRCANEEVFLGCVTRIEGSETSCEVFVMKGGECLDIEVKAIDNHFSKGTIVTPCLAKHLPNFVSEGFSLCGVIEALVSRGGTPEGDQDLFTEGLTRLDVGAVWARG